jgi:hypothetical protein
VANKARRHHFVPEFHLKMFARGRFGLIDQFDKRFGNYRWQPAATSAFEQDYYLLPGQTVDERLRLERGFGDLESNVAPLFRWLDAQPPGPIAISESMRDALSGYAATLHARVPAYRDDALARAREMATDPELLGLADATEFLTAARAFGLPGTDAELEASRVAWITAVANGWQPLRVPAAISLTALSPAVEKVRPLLMSRNWRLVRLLREPGFVIGDQPVTLKAGRRLAPEIGFGTPGVEVFMPISPRTLLLITDAPREGQLQMLVALETPMRLPFWAIANHTAWITSQRWIWAAKRAHLQATETILAPADRRRDIRQLTPELEARRRETARIRRQARRHQGG